MEYGLAAQSVYGDGAGQNTTHYYAGANKTKKKACGCTATKRNKNCKKKSCNK